jgi:septal ring factor EnvC (AmiA/AmiB activator)
MDPEQLKKMTERLGADLRAMKQQLEAVNAEKDRIASEKAERDAAFEKLNHDMEIVRDEKKRNFSELVETDVKPFFQNLKKDQDPRVVENVSIVEQQIANGLNDAFMDKNDMALFQTVRACNSALTATSQELEKMFQSEREWTKKFNALREEKEANEAKSAESVKAIEEERALKDKALEDLKEELTKLKAVHTKNLAAVENHFDATEGEQPVTEGEQTTTTAAAVPTETSTTVRAEASNRTSKFYGGFETLFDFKPRADWRNQRRDDGF